MRAAIALLVDHHIHNFMRKLAVEFHRRYETGFLGALLPPHISLKQPFQVMDLPAMETYFDELAERFENTGASFDGAGYTFHATVAIGGQPSEVYREFYDTLGSKGLAFSYVAREIAMFYYDDTGQPGTYISYRIQPIGGGKSVS